LGKRRVKETERKMTDYFWDESGELIGECADLVKLEVKEAKIKLLKQIIKDCKKADLMGLARYGSGGASLLHGSLMKYLKGKLKRLEK